MNSTIFERRILNLIQNGAPLTTRGWKWKRLQKSSFKKQAVQCSGTPWHPHKKQMSKYHFWGDRMGRSCNDIRQLKLLSKIWRFTQLVSMQGGQKLRST